MTGAELVATFNHSMSSPLGRSGAGLRTGVDEIGGWYEIDLPDTTAGRDVAELVERGILRGSSFTFSLNDPDADQEFTRAEDGTLIRSLRDFTVHEVGPVISPAYPDTSAALRSIERAREALTPKSAPAKSGAVAVTATERTERMSGTAAETNEEIRSAEHAAQRAADDGRTDLEERVLAAIERLDARVVEQETEERAAKAEAETRDAILALIEKHTARPSSRSESDPAFNEAVELRALGNGERPALEFRATMGVTVDPTNKQAGKATPSKTLYLKLTELMAERSTVIAGGATVLTTTGGEVIDFPRVKRDSAAGADGEVAEAAAFGQSYPTTDVVPIGAVKRGHISWLSWELVNDDAVDLVGYLVRTAGPNLSDKFGRAHLAKLIAGVDPALVDDMSAVATPTDRQYADWVIDLSVSVPSAAEAVARWVAGRQVVAKLRKLKDTNGQFLLKTLAEGQGLTLMGRPLVRDVGMESANNLLFSDLSGYTVRRAGGLRVERTTDAKFDTDEIGYKFAMREDGGLVDTTGTALLKLPAVL